MRNRVQLIGHLGMDPELKTFDSGKKLVRVSLATNEVYRNNNGDKVTDTEWHNLVAWGKTAEIINEYTKKGSELAVEGKLTTNTYAEDQTTRAHPVNGSDLLGNKGWVPQRQQKNTGTQRYSLGIRRSQCQL